MYKLGLYFWMMCKGTYRPYICFLPTRVCPFLLIFEELAYVH